MKKTSTVQLVRNVTLKIRYAEHTVLIDPVLADEGILMSALGANRTSGIHLTISIQGIIGGVDMALLTHDHTDHYEPSVLTRSPKEVPFYVRPQDVDVIRNDESTNMISIKEIKTIDGMSVYRTTRHYGFGQIGQTMGPISSYVLKAEGFPIVYMMGDHRWEVYIRDTVGWFNPDYIVVNSGGVIFSKFSKTDGPIVPDENEVMQILDELPSYIKLVAVYMDTIDHCQTVRTILRNEATYRGVGMGRLIIPEDEEAVVL